MAGLGVGVFDIHEIGSHAGRFRLDTACPNRWPARTRPMSAVRHSLTRPVPRPGVLAIEPYVPGKSGAPGVAKVYKLSSNETPLGPSPTRRRGLAARPAASSSSIRTAPSTRSARGDRRDATASIRSASSAAAARTRCCTLLAQAYVGPGDEGIYAQHGFLVYKIAILAAGGTPVVAPETDLTRRCRRDPRRA